MTTDVTYFVEDDENDEPKLAGKTRQGFLEENVFTPETIDLLDQTKGSISIATGQHDDTLKVIQELNSRSIPVDLWLSVSEADGYWLYRGNMEPTRRELEKVLNWKDQKNLHIRNIGFDLEPHIDTMRGLIQKNFVMAFRAKGKVDSMSVAKDKLEQMVDDVQHTGHGADVYKMRFGHWKIWQWLLGMHAIPENANNVVSMLYSSPYIGNGVPVSLEPHLKPNEIPAIGILSGTGINPGKDLGQGLTNPKMLLQDNQLAKDVGAIKKAGKNRFFAFALNHPSVVRRVKDVWDKIV